MADNKKEMERDELHRAIWAIADDLRGAVDGWDFKNYMLVKKYHDTHCEDKEVLVSIKKAIDSSPELRSKKALIENFIAGINEVDDIMIEWHDFVAEIERKTLLRLFKRRSLRKKRHVDIWTTASVMARLKQSVQI